MRLHVLILGVALLLGLALLACGQPAPTPTPTQGPTATPTSLASPSATPTRAPAPTTQPDVPTPTAAAFGTVEIRVTDAPPKGVSKVMVTASKIEAQRTDASGESGWTTVVEAPPVFDLVAVTGLEEVLGHSTLASGSYGQVRLAVTKVVVTIQGKDQEADVPSDKLRVVGGFQVATGQTTVLTLDFDADKSVVLAGPRVQFKPVVKLLAKAPSGQPEAPKRAPSTVAPITGDLVIALNELNASGQKGIAVLTAKGSQTEVLLLATADISELNHIHSGSCAVVGGVAHPFPNMVAGKTSATLNATLDSLLTGGFTIRLHKKGEAATYTSCGDIPAKTDVLTVKLKELNSSGQSGVATLVAKGDKTDVAAYATAGVSELNHIHSGTCTVVGGVAYPFPNMVNGITVATLNAKLDSLQTGGFAIRLHKKGDPATYTACGDIPAKAITAAPTTVPTSAPRVTPTSVSQARSVDIASFAFSPASLTVPVGTTVTWTNQDAVTHTVTADNGAFDSGGLARGQSFSYTFTTLGTFAYHCTPHPNLKGTVTVTQSGTPSSTDGTSSGGMSDYY